MAPPVRDPDEVHIPYHARSLALRRNLALGAGGLLLVHAATVAWLHGATPSLLVAPVCLGLPVLLWFAAYRRRALASRARRERLLAGGQRATATVLGKHFEAKGPYHVVKVRLQHQGAMLIRECPVPDRIAARCRDGAQIEALYDPLIPDEWVPAELRPAPAVPPPSKDLP